MKNKSKNAASIKAASKKDQHPFVPVSGREMPRFSGIKTYFRLPNVNPESDYDVAFVGVPFDGGSSYRSGQRFAPQGVRSVSSLGRVFHWGRMESFTETLRVADIGDIAVVPIDLQKTYERIETFYSAVLAKKNSEGKTKRLISVGGDHSITLPILRSIRKSVGRPVRLIHFDAHLDTYPAAWDCEYHHGSFARHAIEEGLVDPQGSIQIGIRGPLASRDDLNFVKKHGLRVVQVDEIRRGQGVAEFIRTLPDFGNDPVYISYDVDCLDPAFAPGTGTPVPGGLSTYETQQIFRALKVKRLVGADVVEVLPAYDSSEITQLAALDALFEILGLMASSRS